MNDNETTADVIAEKRFDATTRDQFDSAYIVDFCDRFEAAHKREAKELRVEIERLKEERNYSGVRERERLRAKGFAIVPKEQLERGDAAKLREALKLCVDEMCDRCRELAVARGNPLPCLSGCEPVRKAKAALAAPPRNCDRFASAEEAWYAYDEWAESYRAQGKTEPLNEVGWLFATATEKEGGAK